MLLRLTIASVLALTYLIARPTTPMPSASACTLSTPPSDPHLRINLAMERQYNVVLIGTVTKETQVDYAFDRVTGETKSTPVRSPKLNPWPEDAVFQSVVRVDAILSGKSHGNELVIPFLNSLSAGCRGGPRLREGEQVLLFLRRAPGGFFGDSNGSSPTRVDYTWEMSLTGGKILFQNDVAYLEDFFNFYAEPAAQTTSYLGPSENIIREVAAKLGTSPDDTKRAVQALTAPSGTATKNERADLILAAALTLTILLVATTTALTRLRQH